MDLKLSLTVCPSDAPSVTDALNVDEVKDGPPSLTAVTVTVTSATVENVPSETVNVSS